MIFFLQFFKTLSQSISRKHLIGERQPLQTDCRSSSEKTTEEGGNCKKWNTWVIYNPKPAGCPGGYLNQLNTWGWKEQCFVSSEEPVCLINNLNSEWDADLRHIHADLGELYWNLQHDNEPAVAQLNQKSLSLSQRADEPVLICVPLDDCHYQNQ